MASAPRGLLALVTVMVGLHASATHSARAQASPDTANLEAIPASVAAENYVPPRTALHPSPDPAQPAPAPTAEPLLEYSGVPNRYYYASNPKQFFYKPDHEASSRPPGYGIPVMPSNLAGLRLVNPRAIKRISVRITNPRQYGVTISYSINGREDLIPPGGTRYWDLPDQAILIFSRGLNYAEGSYSLDSGSYSFRYDESKEPRGWDIDPHPAIPSAPLASGISGNSDKSDALSLVPAVGRPVGLIDQTPVGPMAGAPVRPSDRSPDVGRGRPAPAGSVNPSPATAPIPGTSDLARNR